MLDPQTRTGLYWTHRYPVIAQAITALPARSAYVDGELCTLRPDGVTSLLRAPPTPGTLAGWWSKI